MKVVPVVALALVVVTSGAASANQFHEQLARMPDAQRNEVFTEQMRKTAEPPCKVTRFLEIGGNSLFAASIVQRILERLGVALPARQLLAASTIADMAAVITDALAERADGNALDRVLASLHERDTRGESA
jgi:acyl carrier protein